MNSIKPMEDTLPDVTILPNDFIDQHMILADGEYVKIYIMILRLIANREPITIDILADKLELTQKDVVRALKYWEKEGLLEANLLSQDKPTRKTTIVPDVTPSVAPPTASNLAPIDFFQPETASMQELTPAHSDVPETQPVVAPAAASFLLTNDDLYTSNATETIESAFVPGQIQTDSSSNIEQGMPIPITNIARADTTTSTATDKGSATEFMSANPLPVVPIEPVPEKKQLLPSDITRFAKGTDLSQTIYMVETYFGRPINPTELNVLCYIDRQLGFSSELLDYLIDYCIDRDKKSMHYIESIAISWYQKHIDTVEKAKLECLIYNEIVSSIMKIFGISGRTLGEPELEFVHKWRSMGFSNELIIEACKRTLIQIQKASFPYTDSILQDWHKSNITTLEQARLENEKYHAAHGTYKEPAEANNNTASNNRPRRIASPNNRFHNFKQRSYDYDDLDARILHRSL